MVQVQRAFALTRFTRLEQRARLASLVARLVEVVRHFVAGASHHAAVGAELAPIGAIGRQDAVLVVEQDVRLRQPFQIRHQFG